MAIGFSAGCVGLRSLLGMRVRRGLPVERFIAIDGWGVPLTGLPFATYRISHDHFSHQTASFLGAGDGAFWAEPAVDHLELWRSPATTVGLCLDPARSATPQPTTAAACILRWAVPAPPP